MSDILTGRIAAAIYDSKVSREVVEFEWPECHKNKCQARHGSPDAAFGHMKAAIAENVRSELDYRRMSRPDVSDTDTDRDPEKLAVYTLAWLLNTYNVHHAGTFVAAAQLIIDAYPTLVDALGVTK